MESLYDEIQRLELVLVATVMKCVPSLKVRLETSPSSVHMDPCQAGTVGA